MRGLAPSWSKKESRRIESSAAWTSSPKTRSTNRARAVPKRSASGVESFTGTPGWSDHAGGASDRSQELSRATQALDQARRHCRPGTLTRARRRDRRRLEEAEARYAAVSAEQDRREDWLAEHAELLAYGDRLNQAVAECRNELGFGAAIASTDLLRLIGPVPASAEASGCGPAWPAASSLTARNGVSSPTDYGNDLTTSCRRRLGRRPYGAPSCFHEWRHVPRSGALITAVSSAGEAQRRNPRAKAFSLRRRPGHR